MVRNWQARVEQADVRRKQAKQKKQLSEDKRLWKQWVVDFVNNQLDLNAKHMQKIIQLESSSPEEAKGGSNSIISHQLRLQIWTDTLPTTNVSESDALVDAGDGTDTVKDRKKRSKSFGENSHDDEETMATGRSSATKGRGRTSSVNESLATPPASSKKKAHPRSKGSLEQSTNRGNGTNESEDTCMCRSFFFTGTCGQMNTRGGGKKVVTCRHMHPSNNSSSQTLCYALTKGEVDSNRSTLQLQKAAAAEILFSDRTASSMGQAITVTSPSNHATTDSVVVEGTMDMVYYIEFPLILKSDNDEPTLPPSSQVTVALSSFGLFLGCVVYVAFNGVLIFDRYQDGSLYTNDQDFLAALFGDHTVSNVLGCKRDHFCTNPCDVALLVNMPASVLLQMASFLPDESIGSMTQVCSTWHNEIGCPDSPLWKFLLDRNDWPYIDGARNKCTLSNLFRQHYTIMRDMRALEKGYLALHSGTNLTGNGLDRDFALHNFSSNVNPPPFGSRCVAVEEWSANRLLLAYNRDCTVRLFETVPKVASNGTLSGDKFCRELICYDLDPYWNTRRMQSSLEQLVLDDDYIIALFHVESLGITGTTEILVAISRDDFLLGESSSVDTSKKLHFVDVEDAVKRYLPTDSSCPPNLVQLIRDHEDFSSMNFTVSKTLSSCGNGMVLIEVILYYESEDGSEMARWLFLVSVTLNQVLWADGGTPEMSPDRGPVEKRIVSRRQTVKGRSTSRSVYDFAVGSASLTFGHVVMGTVDPTGAVDGFRALESSCIELERPDQAESWFRPRNERLIMINSDDVVALDFWSRGFLDSASLNSTVLSFYPRNKPALFDGTCTSDEAKSVLSSVTVPCKVVQIRCIRDLYAVLVCRQPESSRTPNHTDGGAENIYGAWNYSFPVIVVHIPTRREVGRIMLKDGILHREIDPVIVPSLIAQGQATIGMGVSSRGVIMTGDDIRFGMAVDKESIDGANQQIQSATKKKKNSVRSKKDSFRTHNGDRCY